MNDDRANETCAEVGAWRSAPDSLAGGDAAQRATDPRVGEGVVEVGASAAGVCALCRVPKDWNGDDRLCAFLTGTFSGGNWNCGTMNALRDLTELEGAYRARYNDGSLGVVPLRGDADNGPMGYLVMAWYKERGCTAGPALIIDEGDEPLALTLADAERILASFGVIEGRIQ